MLAGGHIVAQGTLKELAKSELAEVRDFFLSWKGA
jgi:hypothetical protein